MSLSNLSDRAAVLQAMAEYDQLGRGVFLARYGYGPSRTYFVVHDGKRYDSKALAGVAHGKQFPAEGPLAASDFSGGDATVKAKLERLGFEVVSHALVSQNRITAADVELLQRSRSRDRYANIAPEEGEAYKQIHSALGHLGRAVVDALGGPDYYDVRLTAGFHLASGIRGGIPKDLWFGVFRRENKDTFLGNPQLYMIVSGRGVEFGFAASTHPSDFSNPDVKARLRAAAPNIYGLLPAPESEDARALEEKLADNWKFRTKSRLEPGRSDFPNLDAWLNFFKSPAGATEGGGCITQYLGETSLDEADLDLIVRDMAKTFRSVMEKVSASRISSTQAPARPDAPEGQSFAVLFAELLRQFADAREMPFCEVPSLWATMGALQSRLQGLPSVRQRPHILVKWSLGKGVWANVPWVALLNRHVTTSTQSGLYVVFLIAEDLSAIYLTLNQGMTDLVSEFGQKSASRTLMERSEAYQAQVTDLRDVGVTLGNDIDLKTEGWRSKNYELSTISYVRFPSDNLPTDDRVEEVIEALLAAYDRLTNEPRLDVNEPLTTADVSGPIQVEEEPYSIEDGMSGLFLQRDEFERILLIWKAKKNIVLQGAPGVGKSFVAKRLAFSLLKRRAPSRVEAVQFHQSYAYEDFVQGYRPTPSGGFVLRDGVFIRFCRAALEDPTNDYVLIIDEINRGNLSKIFGELMLLIEQDKRNPSWATRLSYAQPDDEKFYVPDNLYVIGMMKVPSQSLLELIVARSPAWRG